MKEVSLYQAYKIRKTRSSIKDIGDVGNIEYGVPAPEPWERRIIRAYPFDRMKRLGESFLVKCDETEGEKAMVMVRYAAVQYNRTQKRRNGLVKKFIVRIAPKGVRCWRIG